MEFNTSFDADDFSNSNFHEDDLKRNDFNLHLGELDMRRISLGNDEKHRIRVLSLNANGPTSPPERSGNAKMRYTLIQIILNSHKPDLVLLQEVNLKNLEDRVDLAFSKCGGGNYEVISNGDCRILYNSDVLSGEKLIWDQEGNYHDGRTLINIDDRMAMAKMTVIDQERMAHMKPFTAISFHGVHRGDSYRCTQHLLSLIQSNDSEFLVGGDWNYNLDSLNLPNEFQVYYPNPVRRFDIQIDWMVVKGRTSRLSQVQTLECYNTDGKKLNIHHFSKSDWRTLQRASKNDDPRFWEYALDHDGIMGVFECEILPYCSNRCGGRSDAEHTKSCPLERVECSLFCTWEGLRRDHRGHSQRCQLYAVKGPILRLKNQKEALMEAILSGDRAKQLGVAFKQACQEGETTKVNQILNLQVSENIPIAALTEMIPLHHAVHRGHIEVVRILVQHGSFDPREIDGNTKSAMDYSGSDQMSRLLDQYVPRTE